MSVKGVKARLQELEPRWPPERQHIFIAGAEGELSDAQALLRLPGGAGRVAGAGDTGRLKLMVCVDPSPPTWICKVCAMTVNASSTSSKLLTIFGNTGDTCARCSGQKATRAAHIAVLPKDAWHGSTREEMWGQDQPHRWQSWAPHLLNPEACLGRSLNHCASFCDAEHLSQLLQFCDGAVDAAAAGRLASQAPVVALTGRLTSPALSFEPPSSFQGRGEGRAYADHVKAKLEEYEGLWEHKNHAVVLLLLSAGGDSSAWIESPPEYSTGDTDHPGRPKAQSTPLRVLVERLEGPWHAPNDNQSVEFKLKLGRPERDEHRDGVLLPLLLQAGADPNQRFARFAPERSIDVEAGGGGTGGGGGGKPHEGDRVMAICRGGTRKCPGSIKRDNSDGTYDVEFDDGDRDRAVPFAAAARIRVDCRGVRIPPQQQKMGVATQTVLHLAVIQGQVEVAAALLQHGADVEARRVQENTHVLPGAEENLVGERVLAQLLAGGGWRYGVAVSAAEDKYEVAFDQVTGESRGAEQCEVEKTMLDRWQVKRAGAELDADSETALHLAVRRVCTTPLSDEEGFRMCELLLRHGADAHAVETKMVAVVAEVPFDLGSPAHYHHTFEWEDRFPRSSRKYNGQKIKRPVAPPLFVQQTTWQKVTRTALDIAVELGRPDLAGVLGRGRTRSDSQAAEGGEEEAARGARRGGE